MSDKIPVLNEGYVQLIEIWGSDERIIESARQSTSGGFRGWGSDECTELKLGGVPVKCVRGTEFCCSDHGDQKLLRYLYRNKHMSPFEMAGAIFEVQAPIFVFREWHR